MATEELDQAITRFRNGNYSHVITSGGPAPADLTRHQSTSYAELARDYLVLNGLPANVVSAAPTPESLQDRTYLSAVTVRDGLASSGLAVSAIDVFTSGVHSRRSRELYRMAFGHGVQVGTLATKPGTYDPDSWWKTSIGAKTVISELISWLWTELFFKPAAPGSKEEKWGLAPTDQSAK